MRESDVEFQEIAAAGQFHEGEPDFLSNDRHEIWEWWKRVLPSLPRVAEYWRHFQSWTENNETRYYRLFQLYHEDASCTQIVTRDVFQVRSPAPVHPTRYPNNQAPAPSLRRSLLSRRRPCCTGGSHRIAR